MWYSGRSLERKNVIDCMLLQSFHLVRESFSVSVRSGNLCGYIVKIDIGDFIIDLCKVSCVWPDGNLNRNYN